MSTFISIRTVDGYKNLVLSRVVDLEIDNDVLRNSISDHRRFAYRIRYHDIGQYRIYYTDLENYLLLKNRKEKEMSN